MFETVWSFETDKYTIELAVAPEDTDPIGEFHSQEDIDAINSGTIEWFHARASVSKNGKMIGSDYLGGCAYKTIQEFLTGHRDPDPLNRNCAEMREARGANTVICHYFPDMIRQAISDARLTLAAN